MPPQGVELFEHEKILSYEELTVIIEAAAQLGITSIRLTGGEPLVRRGIIPFIKVISKIGGIDDIAITTNGILLREMAGDLKRAGVKRVNISLDTLDKEKYKNITGKDHLNTVLSAIDKSLEVGLEPIKINVVLLKDFNVNEIIDFVEMTLKKPIHVRFIEMMPLGTESKKAWKDNYIPWTYPLEVVRGKFDIKEHGGPKGQGPAKYYTIPNSQGTFGVISAVSEHFCSQCNRIRLTSDGKIRTCLFGEGEYDIKKIAHTGDIKAVKEALITAVHKKPEGYQIQDTTVTNRFMSQIGG